MYNVAISYSFGLVFKHGASSKEEDKNGDKDYDKLVAQLREFHDMSKDMQGEPMGDVIHALVALDKLRLAYNA
jgi:hypothetical protein